MQSKPDHPRAAYTDTLLCSRDLDLDPMTLIYEPDVDILKLYLKVKGRVPILVIERN